MCLFKIPGTESQLFTIFYSVLLMKNIIQLNVFYSLQLPKMFPDLLMNLQISAREMPMFSFQPGVVKQNFTGAVKALAIQPNGTQTPLFTLNVVSINMQLFPHIIHTLIIKKSTLVKVKVPC